MLMSDSTVSTLRYKLNFDMAHDGKRSNSTHRMFCTTSALRIADQNLDAAVKNTTESLCSQVSFTLFQTVRKSFGQKTLSIKATSEENCEDKENVTGI